MESIYLVPIILAVVQAVKLTGVNRKWLPLTAVVLGIIGGLVFQGSDIDSILNSIITGLAATGLWEVGTRSVGK